MAGESARLDRGRRQAHAPPAGQALADLRGGAMSEAQTQADEIAPSDSTDPIVITGVGLLTPLGLTAEATWAAVRAGQCGVGALTAMATLLPPGSSRGQVADLPDTFEPNLPREVRYPVSYTHLRAHET